jgi:DNA primase
MDAIMAHQHGFDNVVASMGTALTEQQVAEVRRLTADVTMALDADAAGQQATLRSLESSWQVFQNRELGQASGTSIFQRQESLNLKVAVLTDGKDPDEVIRQSPDKWEELLRNGVPLFDYLLPAVTAQIDTSTPEGKARVVEVISPFIFAVDEPIRQDSYVRKLADHLGVREETLQATLNRPNMRARPSRPTARPRTEERPGARNGADASAFTAADRDPMEEYCLAMLLQFPDLETELAETGDLRPEFFRRPENREIYLQLARSWSETREMLVPDDSLPEQVKRNVIPELRQQVENLAARAIPATDSWLRPAELRRIISRLEERHLRDLKMAEQVRFTENPSELLEDLGQETLILNRRIKANQEIRNQHSQNAFRGR